MNNMVFYFILSVFWFQKGIPKCIDDQNKFGNNKFVINNIDSIQSLYIIYAKRHDSIIKIVSKMEKIDNCSPVIIGQAYDLKVRSLLENHASKRHIGGIKVNNVLVKLEGKEVTWDLFICEDLKGLCYVPACATKL
jgi:hypothetical protein